MEVDAISFDASVQQQQPAEVRVSHDGNQVVGALRRWQRRCVRRGHYARSKSPGTPARARARQISLAAKRSKQMHTRIHSAWPIGNELNAHET